MRAGAALDLTGRFAPMARQAAVGLRAWAGVAGADLEVVDCGDDPVRAARATLRLAERVDVLFGPYGSGALRAVADAFRGRPEVVWNHGGAAAPRTGARIVDVLAPAERYWEGLAPALERIGADAGAVAIVHSDSGFGRAVASGAAASLASAGLRPLQVTVIDGGGAAAAGRRALAAGARVVVGCGRYEDDIALARRLAGTPAVPALVACGIRRAGGDLGPAIVGCLGPCQWFEEAAAPIPGLGPEPDYTAVQAYAAGLIAARAVDAAGEGATPDRVWAAALALRAVTPLGAFAVDAEGRQTALCPLIVGWREGPGGPARHVLWRPGERA